MNISSISFIMNICSISKFYFIYDRAFQLKKNDEFWYGFNIHKILQNLILLFQGCIFRSK